MGEERKVSERVEFEVRKGGERLDRFLAESYPDLSRSYIKKLIEEGFVFVEGKEVKKPSRKLKAGERVLLEVPPPPELKLEPENIPIEVIYEDEELAVVVKPCGLVVHPSPGHSSGTLVNALLYRFNALSSEGGKVRPGIVHRLDKETAGLMVVAKTDKAHRELSKQFKERKTEKFYRVLVQGIVEKEHGLIESPIGRHPLHRKKFAVVEGGREAKTEFWRLKTFPKAGATLLKVKIYTGRTHQIRVHLSSIGHPVLGDKTYGFKTSKLRGVPPQLLEGCNMLVAYKLSFFHPVRGHKLSFEIEDPEPFRSVLKALEEFDGKG